MTIFHSISDFLYRFSTRILAGPHTGRLEAASLAFRRLQPRFLCLLADCSGLDLKAVFLVYTGNITGLKYFPMMCLPK